ncbi:hypothetical protein TPA4_69 [Tsukamurella phage TPA4]|uniref:hypothetical protein n=1 Tax=Tsukamurella phage TPA4 TaxID=1647476 RepID=UPI0007B61501|nr:hypothetical protein BH784_gp69 [Tsukamurella phage TPA4]AKJ72234.1 hypothetical protein TPA4_69 [Tsukamurella phage TPA4]
MTGQRIAAAVAAVVLVLVCFAVFIRDMRRPGGGSPYVFLGTVMLAGYGGGYLVRFALTGELM